MVLSGSVPTILAARAQQPQSVDELVVSCIRTFLQLAQKCLLLLTSKWTWAVFATFIARSPNLILQRVSFTSRTEGDTQTCEEIEMVTSGGRTETTWTYEVLPELIIVTRSHRANLKTTWWGLFRIFSKLDLKLFGSGSRSHLCRWIRQAGPWNDSNSTKGAHGPIYFAHEDLKLPLKKRKELQVFHSSALLAHDHYPETVVRRECKSTTVTPPNVRRRATIPSMSVSFIKQKSFLWHTHFFLKLPQRNWTFQAAVHFRPRKLKYAPPPSKLNHSVWAMISANTPLTAVKHMVKHAVKHVVKLSLKSQDTRDRASVTSRRPSPRGAGRGGCWARFHGNDLIGFLFLLIFFGRYFPTE